AVRSSRQCRAVDRLGRAVRPLDEAVNTSRPAAERAHGGREGSLGHAEREACGGGEHAARAERRGGRPETGERGEGAPREGEPEVVVEEPVRDLEVVRDDDEGAEYHERDESGAYARDSDDADRDGACQRERRRRRERPPGD